MLASFLRLTTLLSLAGASLLLLSLWDFSKPLAVMAFFTVPFLVSVIVAIQCLSLRWIDSADPTPRATAAQLVRAWWLETLVALRVFMWWQPFCADQYPDRIPVADDVAGVRGVVMVHGFVCNRAIWTRWFPILQCRAIPYVAVDLEPVFGPIDAYVQIVDAAITKIELATGLAPVVVCHSMGGLAVRAWLRATNGEDRVHRVVTIGSPHHGTLIGSRIPHLRWVANGEQMRFASSWLSTLERQESAAQRRLFTCFYSNCDNIVMPSSNAMLEGADNRFVPGTSHLLLATDTDIIEQTISLLL